MRFSSREQGDKVTFVGWETSCTLETGFTCEYFDKRRKMPSVTIYRYSHAASAMPIENVIGSIVGRLVEISAGVSSDVQLSRGAKETFTQIASRGHGMSVFNEGIGKFLSTRFTGARRTVL